MLIDLHCHSDYSDGAFPAAELIANANSQKLELFAITDHDTCLSNTALERDFVGQSIKGVEVTAMDEANGSNTGKSQTRHLLVFHSDRSKDWSLFADRLKDVQLARKDRVHKIVEVLADDGIEIKNTDFLNTQKTLGRPDVAKALVREGIAKNLNDAFKRFLFDGGKADLPVDGFSVSECLSLAEAAGGVVSLAHPHQYEAEAFIKSYKPKGLSGLEVYYGPYKSKQKRKFRQLAQKHDLVMTGGSDFHGNGRLKPELGIEYPEEYRESIERWLNL